MVRKSKARFAAPAETSARQRASALKQLYRTDATLSPMCYVCRPRSAPMMYGPASSSAAWPRKERITDKMTPIESTVPVLAYFVALVEIHDPAEFQPYHVQFEGT